VPPFAPKEVARTESGLIVYRKLAETYLVESVHLVSEASAFTLMANQYSLAGMVEVFPGEPRPPLPAAIALERHGIDHEVSGLTKLEIITQGILDEIVKKARMHERDQVPVLSALITARHNQKDYHIHVMVGASRSDDGSYRLTGDRVTADIS